MMEEAFNIIDQFLDQEIKFYKTCLADEANFGDIPGTTSSHVYTIHSLEHLKRTLFVIQSNEKTGNYKDAGSIVKYFGDQMKASLTDIIENKSLHANQDDAPEISHLQKVLEQVILLTGSKDTDLTEHDPEIEGWLGSKLS